MTYLGIQIIDDGFIYYCRKLPGAYMSLDNLKADIRELVLSSYQPVKTLAWLKEQTGHPLRYLHNHKQLVSIGYNDVYDFNDNTTCVYNNKICIINESANGDWVKMSPQEFIEKIARGEWI